MAFRESGLSGREIIRHFIRFSNPTNQIFTKESARALKLNGLLSIEHYNPMEFKEFLKPLLIEFVKRNLDRDQIGVELERLEIRNLNKRYYEGSAISNLFLRLFDGRSLTDLKFVYVEPIIEHLVREGLSAGKIAIEMGWCSAQSTKQVIQSMSDRVMSYLKGRWGFTKITAARAFFKTHYLGHHEYEYYFID